MTCPGDWLDEQLPDLLDEELELEGPHLWLRRRWVPITDLPDLATHAA